MKKIKIIFLLMLLTFSVYSYSQITLNAKAGVNLSTVDNYDNKFKTGYQVSFGMEYSFDKTWSIRPSLQLVTKGVKGTYSYMQGFGDGMYTINNNPMYIDLPLMGAVKLPLSNKVDLVFMAGPYFAYGIAGKRNLTNKYGSSESDYFFSGNHFDIGAGGGVGIDMSHFLVELNYEWGLLQNSKNRTYSLSLGYQF